MRVWGKNSEDKEMINPPKTKEEAKAYLFNQWSGNPKGNQYNDSRCAYEVAEGGRSVLFYQCLRKPGHGPDGLFCKQHAAKMI